MENKGFLKQKLTPHTIGTKSTFSGISVEHEKTQWESNSANCKIKDP